MSSFLAKIIDRLTGKNPPDSTQHSPVYLTQHREWRPHPFSLPAPRLSQRVEVEALLMHSPEKTWSTLMDVSTHAKWLNPDLIAYDHPRSRRPGPLDKMPGTAARFHGRSGVARIF
jgi:hypothetical protein